jgi:hypothetical protein
MLADLALPSPLWGPLAVLGLLAFDLTSAFLPCTAVPFGGQRVGLRHRQGGGGRAGEDLGGCGHHAGRCSSGPWEGATALAKSRSCAAA